MTAAPVAASLEVAPAMLAVAPMAGLQAALPGFAADPLTAAALGLIYTSYWVQVLGLPSGEESEAAISRITDDMVARILALRTGDHG